MSNLKLMAECRANGEVYRGLFEQGLSVREIAQQAGVHRNTVERWVFRIFKCQKRHPTTNWTEEMDNTLKDMWEQHRPATEIGKALGMSKGSVLGRRFRLKLENHAPGGCHGDRKPRAKGVKRAAKETLITQHSFEPVGFMGLAEHHCREVIGKGMDGLAVYCGCTRVGFLHEATPIYVSPYCTHHSDINYAPSSRG